MKKEGNVLLTLSGKGQTANTINALLVQLEISLSEDRSSIAIDHFQYDTLSSGEEHDTLILPRPGKLRSDTKPFFSGDGVLAIPHAEPQILNVASPLVAPILKAPPTAYQYNPKDESNGLEKVTTTGSQLALVSAFQAHNSARLTVLGSVESLEDKWFSASVKRPSDKKELKTVNREFAQQLSAWTFNELGVLKVNKIEHYLADEPEIVNPSMYRIKKDIVRQAQPNPRQEGQQNN